MATEEPSGAADPADTGAPAPAGPQPDQRGGAAAGPGLRPPVAEINLVDDPELDRSPDAFGQKVAEGKRSSDAEFGANSDIAIGDVSVGPPQDLDQSRDVTRQTITLWLIGLLCAIVVLTFVALFARGASTGFTDKAFFQELKQVLDVLLGPVITLLASAIGFYFGYKQGELGNQARNNKPPQA